MKNTKICSHKFKPLKKDVLAFHADIYSAPAEEDEEYSTNVTREKKLIDCKHFLTKAVIKAMLHSEVREQFGKEKDLKSHGNRREEDVPVCNVATESR